MRGIAIGSLRQRRTFGSCRVDELSKASVNKNEVPPSVLSGTAKIPRLLRDIALPQCFRLRSHLRQLQEFAQFAIQGFGQNSCLATELSKVLAPLLSHMLTSTRYDQGEERQQRADKHHREQSRDRIAPLLKSGVGGHVEITRTKCDGITFVMHIGFGVRFEAGPYGIARPQFLWSLGRIAPATTKLPRPRDSGICITPVST